MAIDFPPVVTDPSQPWTNPDTGITYIYKDGAWRVISQSNIVDINDEFVNVSGDNMTGALTIGPAGSSVTTLADNGSATFNNSVTSIATSASDFGFLQGYAGASSRKFGVRGSGELRIGPNVTTNDAGNVTIKLEANGNATFAGVITQGNYNSSSAEGQGAYIGSGYIISQQPASATSTTPIWQGRYGTGSDSVTSQITTSGSATFAGIVETEGVRGSFISPQVPVDSSDATWGLFSGKDYNGNVTSQIKGDGSATFAGNITAGNVSFNLEPDNDANYVTTTDVDEEGNTVENRVYNGPTLDVKERLTKADTALQTLKTAAAAAVDFAELKAAIATALADI